MGNCVHNDKGSSLMLALVLWKYSVLFCWYNKDIFCSLVFKSTISWDTVYITSHCLGFTGVLPPSCGENKETGVFKGPPLPLAEVPVSLKSSRLIGQFILETIRCLSCRWRSRTAHLAASPQSFSFLNENYLTRTFPQQFSETHVQFRGALPVNREPAHARFLYSIYLAAGSRVSIFVEVRACCATACRF